MTHRIYYLKCPLLNDLVYVGQTKRSINKRLSSHISEYRRTLKTGKDAGKKFIWLKKLDALGLLNKVEIYLIEECEESKVNDREIFWIDFYKDKNLVNTSGGGGIQSEETRKKISESKIGDKNPMWGKKLPDWQIKLLKEAGSTPEVLKKLLKIRQTEEFKKKISDAFSKPIVVLDCDFNEILEFKNSYMCADYFGYKKANILNAIRSQRPIGKWIGKLMWLVLKSEKERGIEKIKNNPNNSTYILNKTFKKSS